MMNEWCMRRVRLWDMLVSRVCIQEQRKQSFLTLAKENQSHIGLYWDLRYRSCNADVLHHPPERLPLMTVRWSERDVFITFEIWIFFLRKRMDLLQEAFIYSGHQSRVRHVLLWMHTLYLTTCGQLNRKSYTPRMSRGWVKHRLIFIFGWTNPLRKWKCEIPSL